MATIIFNGQVIGTAVRQRRNFDSQATEDIQTSQIKLIMPDAMMLSTFDVDGVFPLGTPVTATFEIEEN